MSHFPVNHPLRPLYRTLAALTAMYVLVFGVVGLVRASGSPFFGRDDLVVLGLPTNLAFAATSVVAGAVILLAAFVGRNVDRAVNVWAGVLFMAAGTGALALLHTDLNVLNFSVATVIVSFLIGLVLFTAGLYGRSAAKTA
jgi:hypothetical protein